jgi:predicted nucleotidyltransferase
MRQRIRSLETNTATLPVLRFPKRRTGYPEKLPETATMKTIHDIAPALTAFTNAVRTLYGSRLERIVLFGSFARGTAHEGSDVDVAVVLKGDVQEMAEIETMLDAITDTILEHCIAISVVPLSEQRFTSNAVPLVRNIRQEGIVL